jgi:hypothetical protein
MISSKVLLSLLRVVTAISCFCFALGCNRPVDEAEARRQLSGRWVLNTERNCTYGAIESDELVLFPDGRMGQHLKLRDGRAFDSTNERWSFMPKTNVGLESRWNFPADAKAPTKESESLIVEFGRRPVIVIDPDSNCFYMKMQ